ncbi:MAG: hypothetical protein HYZ91_01850 [Candidatus Omnitrophica bacterium]|nr:hypothetical protein [Candidatus Omnitrophota bacterium]
MSQGPMCRALQIGLVVAGLTCPALPIAWAQLEDVDPALHAAVEALVKQDPEVAQNPELAQICRNVAEATVLDPRERAAVTREVVELHREGVNVNDVIPKEVREAVREEFTRVQGQMREQLDGLRASDPGKAREMELSIREGERCMQAFEQGERYVPSPEMVSHAEGMMREWETDAIAHGAPPEFVEQARAEFARWSMSGETSFGGMTGGPGEMGGGPGGMPSLEQMEQMVANGQMTPEQLQMAKDYTQGGFEHMGPGPGAFESYGPSGGNMEAYGPGADAHMSSPTEAFEKWASSPEAQYVSREQLEQYREMAEQGQKDQMQREFENQTYDNKQQQQYDQSQPPPSGEVLVAIHDHTSPGGPPDGIPDEYHYDVNGDGIADHAHPNPH